MCYVDHRISIGLDILEHESGRVSHRKSPVGFVRRRCRCRSLLSESKMTRFLQGAYDLHVHCSPDVVPRIQDVYDLAAAASAAAMAGVGLKDHTTSTVGRCHTLNRLYPTGPRFYSSIALNPPVGGLNPSAVEAALQSG